MISTLSTQAGRRYRQFSDVWGMTLMRPLPSVGSGGAPPIVVRRPSAFVLFHHRRRFPPIPPL